MKIRKASLFIAILIALSTILTSCFGPSSNATDIPIPEGGYGVAYVDYNDGIPNFTVPDKPTSYEHYSELDALGRCGVAEACIGRDLMPTEDRGDIGSVTPSGWNQKAYPTNIVDGGYLYNRSHLIGFQLTGENANERNLITGTRYFNVEGMLPFENMVADYIKETNNHVLYRVTPVYEDREDLVPHGVIIEALSVEDGGDGISFSVYVFNVQPGVVIDYYDGSSYLSGEKPPEETTEPEPPYPEYYVINTSSKKFHLPTCSGAANIKEQNREERPADESTRDALINESYSPCGICKP